MNMKKLAYGLSAMVAGAALVFGASGAFFSDTETSTGNVLAAGAIDLKIDNTSYVTNADGVLVASPNTSWELSDLTVQRFFDFRDLKPGDIGEDTISIHVEDNDAWLCAAARVTDDSDQTCNEPELADDPTCTEPGLGQGELDEELTFVFWADDGDNVFESDEFEEGTFLVGPLSDLGTDGKIALADSTGGPLGPDPVPGDTTVYIGKAWCFGAMSPAPVVQDGLSTSGPLVRGTGFTCDGAPVNNASQTDQVVGDLQFYAIQSRNNDEFTCAEDYDPLWPSASPSPTVSPTIPPNLQ